MRERETANRLVERRAPAEGRPPSERDCRIDERHIIKGETQERVAAAYGLFWLAHVDQILFGNKFIAA